MGLRVAGAWISAFYTVQGASLQVVSSSQVAAKAGSSETRNARQNNQYCHLAACQIADEMQCGNISDQPQLAQLLQRIGSAK